MNHRDEHTETESRAFQRDKDDDDNVPMDDHLGTDTDGSAIGLESSQEIHQGDDSLDDPNGANHEFPEIEIVHATPTAIFVNKPSGMLVHNSAYAGPPEVSLRMAVGKQLGQRVYPIHRIDRPTSGIVGLALEREHVSGWQHALGAAQKRYIGVAYAVVDTTPRMIDHHVKVRPGEKKDAQTEILGGVVSDDRSCTLLAYQLHSGRKHQIRQHMKHLSRPLLEDTTYSKGRYNQPFRDRYGLRRLALHAHTLTIRSPDDDELIEVVCELPPDLLGVFDSLFDEGVLNACRVAMDGGRRGNE